MSFPKELDSVTDTACETTLLDTAVVIDLPALLNCPTASQAL